jgi:hypothetical protein
MLKLPGEDPACPERSARSRNVENEAFDDERAGSTRQGCRRWRTQVSDAKRCARRVRATLERVWLFSTRSCSLFDVLSLSKGKERYMLGEEMCLSCMYRDNSPGRTAKSVARSMGRLVVFLMLLRLFIY